MGAKCRSIITALKSLTFLSSGISHLNMRIPDELAGAQQHKYLR
jgi:hypothetical protein